MAYGNKLHKVMGYEMHHLPHTSPKRVRNKNNNNKQEIDIGDFELSFNFNLAHFIAFTLSAHMIQFAGVPAIITMIFIVLSAGKVEKNK